MKLRLAQEDLTDHLEQCTLDRKPAVIIIDEFQAFAKRSKQSLIYTLLDFMHNKKMLFALCMFAFYWGRYPNVGFWCKYIV